jgi:hypothetical protein
MNRSIVGMRLLLMGRRIIWCWKQIKRFMREDSMRRVLLMLVMRSRNGEMIHNRNNWLRGRGEN